MLHVNQSVPKPEDHALIISNAGKALLTFQADGTITVEPAAKPDERAAEVIAAMRHLFQGLIDTAVREALADKAKKEKEAGAAPVS